MGLDASTATIGVSLLKVNDELVELVHYEYFKPSKDGEIFEKLAEVYNFIQNKIKELKPDEIVLEDIILFMAGKSTAKTICGLAIINRTVGLAIYNLTGKPPILLNVLKIRHTIKLDKKFPSKEEIPALIAIRLGIEFPWIYKTNKKTGVVKILTENFDIADSISAAYAHILLSKPKEVKPKKIKK